MIICIRRIWALLILKYVLMHELVLYHVAVMPVIFNKAWQKKHGNCFTLSVLNQYHWRLCCGYGNKQYD